MLEVRGWKLSALYPKNYSDLSNFQLPTSNIQQKHESH